MPAAGPAAAPVAGPAAGPEPEPVPDAPVRVTEGVNGAGPCAFADCNATESVSLADGCAEWLAGWWVSTTASTAASAAAPAIGAITFARRRPGRRPPRPDDTAELPPGPAADRTCRAGPPGRARPFGDIGGIGGTGPFGG